MLAVTPRAWGAVLLVFASVLGVSLPACAQTCEAPVTTGSQFTGTIDYTAGDGASTSSAVTSGGIGQGESESFVTLSGSFTDALGQARPFTINLPGLETGSSSPLSGAQVCFSLVSEASPTCADLEGTIDVESLSSTCIAPYGCSTNIQATLTAMSHLAGTSFAMTATLDTNTTAGPRMCSDGG